MKRLLAILLLILAPGVLLAGPWCYRPSVVSYPVSYAPPVYQQPYYPPYYAKEYVPYVLEVEVYRDRYYALSDLYRDRMYIEAFDMMRSMREKMDREQPQQPAPQSPPQAAQGERSPVHPPTRPAAVPQSHGKTTQQAAAVLAGNCLSCHGKGGERLDLSDPDAVPATMRYAAFGMMVSRDMPKAPVSKAGLELEKWKSENGVKDDDLKAVFDGWVALKAKVSK